MKKLFTTKMESRTSRRQRGAPEITEGRSAEGRSADTTVNSLKQSVPNSPQVTMYFIDSKSMCLFAVKRRADENEEDAIRYIRTKKLRTSPYTPINPVPIKVELPPDLNERFSETFSLEKAVLGPKESARIDATRTICFNIAGRRTDVGARTIITLNFLEFALLVSSPKERLDKSFEVQIGNFVVLKHLGIHIQKWKGQTGEITGEFDVTISGYFSSAINVFLETEIGSLGTLLRSVNAYNSSWLPFVNKPNMKTVASFLVEKIAAAQDESLCYYYELTELVHEPDEMLENVLVSPKFLKIVVEIYTVFYEELDCKQEVIYRLLEAFSEKSTISVGTLLNIAVRERCANTVPFLDICANFGCAPSDAPKLLEASAEILFTKNN